MFMFMSYPKEGIHTAVTLIKIVCDGFWCCERDRFYITYPMTNTEAISILIVTIDNFKLSCH